MRNTLIQLLGSLMKTFLIAGVISGIAYLAGYPSLIFFSIAVVMQFVAFYMFNKYLEYKSIKDARLIEIKEMEAAIKSTMTVTCANCKKENDIIVDLSQENKYICGHCKTKNSVYIFAETAVVTEPLYEAPSIPNTNAN
jgi:type III secretory pathway component EscV